MRVIFDLEADGLEPTKIFVLCAKTLDEGLTHQFFDADSWKIWVKQTGVTELIGHNIINYDLPVLSRLWDFNWDGKIIDTLVLSRLASPARDGGHSLKNWGFICDFNKGEHDDFKSLSNDMVQYCIRDVLLSERVIQRLRRDIYGFSKQSIQLEHDVAKIMGEQERRGWKIDEKKAMLLLFQLTVIKDELDEQFQKIFPPLITKEYVYVKYKKDGSLYNAHKNLKKDEQGYYREMEEVFNPASRQQIVERLKMLGWEPTVLTEKGNVKIDETILKTIDIPEAKLLIDFFLISKRIVMINAWVDAVQKDGRVHGKVNSCGAISGRMTHFSPNMAQIPANYSKWGTECRELWIAEEGNILVGCDASGLELRMLAHYINDKDFTNEILNGDIHTYNQRLAGIDTRDKAKTFIYAFIYGAGDGKLGQIIKGTTYDGAKLRERFLLALPKLEKLARAVRYATKKGYIKGLDGRKLYPRSPHSSLNLLLQNAGAIIMKRALTYLSGSDIIKDQKGYFVGNIHDEIQMEVEKGYEEQLGREAIQAIIKAGENYDLKIPLGGEYSIGHSWSQTH